MSTTPAASSSSKVAKTTNTTKTAKTPPMPDALVMVSLDEALTELRDLDARWEVIPAAARVHLLEVAGQVIDAAMDLGLSNASELVTCQDTLLKALTGTAPRLLHKTAVADALHTYRNMMLTLTVAATASFHGDPSGLYARMMKLPARTHSPRRSLTDDEVLLARVAIDLISSAEPGSTTAAVYCLVEAGMTPGETTSATLADYDDEEMPQTVLAAGNKQIQARFLPLDRFNSVVLGRGTELAHRAGHPRTKPINYNPRKHAPGTSEATASAQGVIDRFLKELGLFNADTTATSIRLWRLTTTLAATDFRAAQELGGFGEEAADADRLWRALGFLEKPQKDDANDEGPHVSFL